MQVEEACVHRPDLVPKWLATLAKAIATDCLQKSVGVGTLTAFIYSRDQLQIMLLADLTGGTIGAANG